MSDRDEQRKACIEAIERAAAANAAGTSREWATAILDALNGLARVCPIEATNEMLQAGARILGQESGWSDSMSCWNAMTATGDLTNPPGRKP